MSNDPVPPGVPEDKLREYLLSELRAAQAAAIRAGADPDVVTADLNERLRKVRLMLSATGAGPVTDASCPPAPVADADKTRG